MSLQLPETLVLSITVHGVIDAQGVDVPTFQVPDGMRITKISAVVPGVCNVMEPDDTTKVNNAIKALITSPASGSYESIVRNLPGTIAQFKAIETTGLKDLQDPRIYAPDPQVKQFIAHADKGYSVVSYDPKQPMIDKMYTRSIGEGSAHAADFKITMMNIPGTPDLFTYVLTGRLGATTTRASEKQEDLYGLQLSDMVDFVKNVGVKNIVLFDFSCSEMPDVSVSDRTKRLLRLRLKKATLNGGKRTRRRKNKTKTRKGKKRTVSRWSH